MIPDCAMLVAFGTYITAVLLIGLLASRLFPLGEQVQRSGQEFIIGGRAVNYWVTAISAQASDMSGWLFMAYPAAVYLRGTFSVWIGISLFLGMWACWQFVAPALRRASAQFGAPTLISLFEAKYADTSGRITIASALIMTFFFTIYLAAGIKEIGYLVASCFGVPYHVGGVIAVAVTLIYTLAGGFVAAAWVAFFQGLFLLATLFISLVASYLHVGGFSAIVDAATTRGISLSLFPDVSTGISVLLGPVAWGLGYFGMPHVLSKFMGAQRAEEMHKSKFVGLTWQALALSAAAAVGFVAIAYFKTPLARPELAFITMTLERFPAFFAGLILCGIMAATLSSMNAQSLVFAGVVAHDLYKKFFFPDATAVQVLWVFRAAIVAVPAVAFAVAWDEARTIFSLVQFAWGGLGASFGPLTLLTLHNAPVNKYGALWGIMAGGLTAGIWKFFDPIIAGMQVNEMLPGFFIGMITILSVSRWLKPDVSALLASRFDSKSKSL